MEESVTERASIGAATGHNAAGLRREAYTMALYVAVCLVAALLAVDNQNHVSTLVVIWGTTIGLAVAHLFAFRLAGRLVGYAKADPDTTRLAAAQLAGAVFVALVATIPALLFPPPGDVDITLLMVSGLIGLAAYVVGRSSGAGRLRSAVFAISVSLVAAAIAVIKNGLVGH